MIRIAISLAAYDALASTMPEWTARLPASSALCC
jgi:hypothetical protein